MKKRPSTEEVEPSRWAELVAKGTLNAVNGLSQMVGRKLEIRALDLRRIPTSEAANLVGGATNEVAAIYLGISGGATGHIMLVYPTEVAFGVVDMLMGYEAGETQELGEMETSALAEVGNVTGSFFLNSLGNDTGILLHPSPPVVMLDMAGAILDVAISDIMQERDEIFAMEALFTASDRSVSGTLLVLPTGDFMDSMSEYSL
ncbi:MAG: chemotaxis protein CheC [Dehalococcoidia bacterium]